MKTRALFAAALSTSAALLFTGCNRTYVPQIAVQSLSDKALCEAIVNAGGCPVQLDPAKCSASSSWTSKDLGIPDACVLGAEFPDSVCLDHIRACNVPVMGENPNLHGIDSILHHRPNYAADIPQLVQEAALYHRARVFMDTHLCLDSHCDLPYRYKFGQSLGKRNLSQVNIQKMSEGGQDVECLAICRTNMKVEEDGYAKATDWIFGRIDKIEADVEAHKDYCAIARTAAEAREIVAGGKKAYFMAIENAFFLGDDISKVGLMAERGILYITLCHTYDNAVCGTSAPHKDGSPSTGLTEYGRSVVKEMNDKGVVIDLSHASEQTFYDVMQCSSKPVVCTHSACRDLYDHNRNVTDAQLRAIAANGGVVQVLCLGSFMRKDKANCSVDDMVQHIIHAVDIAGIDHVGIGSDFDGGGGASDFYGSNDMINVTLALMRKGFSDNDLAKLWGGNFLRVLEANGR